jgi:cell wall-associated NlpC family hydrolase
MRFSTIGLLTVLACPSVWSNPLAADDELGKLLAEKGVIGQIQQFGQAAADRASVLASNAIGFLGVPYRRGGNTLESGFDCSGFVRAIVEQSFGLLLPRQAEKQAEATVQIDRAELQPGDLVFFNTLKRTFSHVGIYVGDGRFIHSPKPGSLIRLEDMGKPYWTRRFDGARRVTASTPEPQPVR